MPVLLPETGGVFPSEHYASAEGLLAIGGSLSEEMLLTAYGSGIFPWYSDDTPILWWTPPERCILFPQALHIPRSLHRTLNARTFTVTTDTCFEDVIVSCGQAPRPDQDGTWITPDMIDAYIHFHKKGYAHSVEAWSDGRLAGGIYGVALGGVFFGESMFYHAPNASKVALVYLVQLLVRWGYHMLDCQQVTNNLLRFGAHPVPRGYFLQELHKGLALPGKSGLWTMPEDIL